MNENNFQIRKKNLSQSITVSGAAAETTKNTIPHIPTRFFTRPFGLAVVS